MKQKYNAKSAGREEERKVEGEVDTKKRAGEGKEGPARILQF